MPELAEPPLGLQNEFHDPLIRRIKPVDSDVFEAEMHGLNGRLAGLGRSVEEVRQQQGKLDAKIDVPGTELREEIKDVRQEIKDARQEVKEGFDKVDAKFDKVDVKIDAVRQEMKGMFSRQTQLLAVVISAIGLLVVLMRFIRPVR